MILVGRTPVLIPDVPHIHNDQQVVSKAHGGSHGATDSSHTLTVSIEPDHLWILGVCICILGTCFTALGLALQKYSHVRIALSKDAKRILQPWWILGLTVFLVGQASNVISMAWAPQAMLSALGSLSLLFNILFARLMLGEFVTRLQVFAMIGVIAGVVLVICFVPVLPPTRAKQHASQVAADILLQADFIGIFCAFFFVCTVGSIAVPRWFPDYTSAFWTFTTACASGYTVTLFKCGAIVLLGSTHPWSSTVFYIIIVLATILCIAQVQTLNVALRLGTATTVVPVYFSLGMLMQLFQAHIAFNELRHLSSVRDLVPFFAGVGLVLVSIVVLLRKRADPEADVGLPEESRRSVSNAAGESVSTPQSKAAASSSAFGSESDDSPTSQTAEDGASKKPEQPDEDVAEPELTEKQPRIRRTRSEGGSWFAMAQKRLAQSRSARSQSVYTMFPSSIEDEERAYTVSVTGPMGIA